MRYLLIIKAIEYSVAVLAEDKDYREEMIAYKKSLAKNGALLSDEALQTSTTGLRITYPKKDGKAQVLVSRTFIYLIFLIIAFIFKGPIGIENY